MSSISTLGFTSIIILLLLLVTFVIVIFLMYRQQVLAESKSDFINNLTHEFKTPISSISLAGQILADKSIKLTDDMLSRYAGIINTEAKRLSFQVEKILQMSMLQSQRSIMKYGEADIHQVLDNAIEIFQLSVKNKGGQISSDLQAKLHIALVDEMHFTNVIFNLLENALKYSKPDEALLLKICTWNDADNSRLYISVEDNGIGIKQEYQRKIFDKFQRVPTGNVHNVKGFGLGLAYVKDIVKKHKGNIKVESEFGIGTKFIINIPILNK